jgi:hypothetical protein
MSLTWPVQVVKIHGRIKFFSWRVVLSDKWSYSLVVWVCGRLLVCDIPAASALSYTIGQIVPLVSRRRYVCVHGVAIGISGYCAESIVVFYMWQIVREVF